MFSDFRFAIRQLFKTPGFTAVVVLSLAVGIGSTTTVFCWLQSMWLNPLPGVRDQASMQVLAPLHGNSQWACCSLPDIEELQQQSPVFDGIIGSQLTPACLRDGRRQEWIYGQVATANFFDVLGVKPLLGRTFFPDEDKKAGGNAVLVISEKYWRSHFGGDSAVIGRTVELNRHPFTIIGVTPKAFLGTMSGIRCDFWAPVSMTKQVATFGSLDRRTDRWLHTQLRLRPGVSREQAQAALDLASAQLQKAYPRENDNITFRMLSFSTAPYGVQPLLMPAFRILLFISFGVLLVVAANVGNLLLARGATRQKEIAVRLALGASRFRIIRQLFIESLLLALVGGAAGVVLTIWMLELMRGMTPPSNLPVGITVELDWSTLGYASLMALSSAFVFGLVPAWQSTRPDLNTTLKEGGRGSGTSHGHQRLRQIFVVAEISVSLVLLVCAGLCLRSVNNHRQASFGFNPDHVLTAGLRIGMHGYDEKTGKEFYQKLQRHLNTVPGIRSAALASWFPLGFERTAQHYLRPEGYQAAPGEDMLVPYVIVSPSYFATMGTPLLQGRDFTDNDTGDAESVAIVNQAFADRFWPGQNALGHKFHDGSRLRTVVGLVGTGKYYAIQEPALPFFYTPFQQGVWDLNLSIVVRTEGEPSAFAQTLSDAIHQVDPGVEAWGTLPMRTYMKAAFIAPVLAARLLTTMGLIALGLSAIGVYAVMAYVVSERTREFALRIALGANPASVLVYVLRYSAKLAAIGIALGLVAALGASRLLASILYNVNPVDPLAFLGVAALLALVAVGASWLPARRAVHSDPSIHLRAE